MERSKEMQETLDHLSKKIFGRSHSECLANNECVSCGAKAVDFRDELSVKEYQISGMCQKCQDQIFEEV